MNYLLILLINLIYLPTIWYGLVSDDAQALIERPYNVKRMKSFCVLLHITVAEYIYFAFGANQVSLIAALNFSIHPLTIQVPVWVSGRGYGLNALIFLVVLAFAPFGITAYCFLNKGISTLLFTPLLFLFTKYWYIALVFPVLLWYDYKYIKMNVTSKIKGGDKIFTPVLQEDFQLHKFKWKNLIIVVKTFGYYSLACLLPIKNGFYNSFLTTLGSSKKATDYCYSFNRHFWGGIFAIILMSILWWHNRFNQIGMGIGLFVLSIGPFLNFITVQQLTAPRYAYLPLIGFQVALVGLLTKLPMVNIGILSALFLFYLDRTIRLLPHYKKDNITMIILDSQVFPDNPRLWYFRYEHFLHKNNPVMAWAEATYGLKYLPEDCQLWFGLAVASYELGDMNAAGEFLKTSERFMILAERNNMIGLVNEMRARIKTKLEEKYIKSIKRRF